MCGEKIVETIADLLLMGSPPRVRGKVIVDLVLTKGHGITPAYAGKSLSLSGWSSGRQDHPRVCGEKHFFVIWFCPM